MHSRQPRVFWRATDGFDVLIEGEELPVRSEALQDGTCVTSASEGGVDVDAVGIDGKSVDGLAEQCWYVINFF